MQKQIRKDGAYDPSLRSSRRARHDAAVLYLHRSLQPAFDVEQHPGRVRMMTDRLEHQFPIDAVEVSFDVDVEHPVVSPAALTGLAHCIDRRFAGSVAVGVRMKYRLQNRLQVTTDDLLGTVASNCTLARSAFGIGRDHSPLSSPPRSSFCCAEDQEGLGHRDVEPAPYRKGFICSPTRMD